LERKKSQVIVANFCIRNRKNPPAGNRCVRYYRESFTAVTSSKSLAQLIGPALIAVSLSEALNLKIWTINIAPVTYLNGFILFVAGISIIRVHNLWTRSWTVLITLVGWGALAGGLARMFAPEAQQGGKNVATYMAITILFAIGIVLTVKGYGRQS
jgi:hypothetical protein